MADQDRDFELDGEEWKRRAAIALILAFVIAIPLAVSIGFLVLFLIQIFVDVPGLIFLGLPLLIVALFFMDGGGGIIVSPVENVLRVHLFKLEPTHITDKRRNEKSGNWKDRRHSSDRVQSGLRQRLIDMGVRSENDPPPKDRT